MASLQTVAPAVNGQEEAPRKVDIFHHGDRLIVPEGMDLAEVAKAIERQRAEEEVLVQISETTDAFPLDGAVALMRVLSRRYGWTNLIPEDMGFWGKQPPAMIGVQVGAQERLQVPWGQMTVPKIDGKLETAIYFNNGLACFRLGGVVKRKHEKVVAALAEEVRACVREHSIYRGQAVKLQFRDNDGDRKSMDHTLAPQFIDLDSVGADEPIFSTKIEVAIRHQIHNPIRFAHRCGARGVALRKGVLLGGPYGVGKTLAAFQAARICQENGWTFLYLEDVRDLDLAIHFARLYEPCLLFAEDVDRVASGPRTPEMDRILNVIDGVEAKVRGRRLLMVLTSNAPSAINPAFIRPGRVDHVIDVQPPDADAGLRIVRRCTALGDCTLAGTDAELKQALHPLLGANAAFYRNAVDVAKLAAIETLASDDAPLVVYPEHLRLAAEASEPHCRLINPSHGSKPLGEDEGDTVHDPMQIAMKIVMQKVAEAVLRQITNPKVLLKIITRRKEQRRRRASGYGDPSGN